MNDLNEIAAKLDEETAALNKVGEQINHLFKYGKTNRFLVTISIIAVVIAAISLGYAIHASGRANEAKLRTHDLTIAAKANRDSQFNTCVLGNETRAEFKQFFVGLIPAGTNPNEPKVKAFLDTLNTSPAFAHRDCTALTDPVVPASK